MRATLLTFLTLVFLLPVSVSAQLDTTAAGSEPFTASVNPLYPTPFGQATISFVSASLDLANSTMVMTIGGKQFYKGNVQSTSVPLGKAGSVTIIKIGITYAGTTYNKTITIQPQEVSLIVEPIASVPALYPGKPLIPLEGDSRIVAIANIRDAAGRSIDPSTLSYTWTVENTRIADSSGIGKTSIIVASPLRYRDRPVSVIVQSSNGSLVGGGSLMLNPTEPTVRIYENDPLLGIRFDHVLSNSYSIGGAETSLFAAPFSFPITRGAPLLRWFLNGLSAQTGSSLTLRPAGNGKGTASLSLTASSGDMSQATADLSLIFGAKPSTNFFGL